MRAAFVGWWADCSMGVRHYFAADGSNVASLLVKENLFGPSISLPCDDPHGNGVVLRKTADSDS